LLTIKKAKNVDIFLYNAPIGSAEANFTTSTLISSRTKENDTFTVDYTLKFVMIVLPQSGSNDTNIEFEYGVIGEANPDWYRWYLMYLTGHRSSWVGVMILLMLLCYIFLLCFGCFFYACKKCCPKKEVVIVKENPYE